MIINPMITIYVYLVIGGLALMGVLIWKWYFAVEDYEDDESDQEQ